MDIYKAAVQRKRRFVTSRGLVNLEDLFELSLTALDLVAKNINKNLKLSEEESFISVKSSANSDLQLDLDIVKDVIADKLADKAEREGEITRAEKKAKLLSILANKQDDALENLSEEELKKQLAELN